MSRKRSIEFSAIGSFVLVAISFTAYVTGAADWIAGLPVTAAGVLAFAGWLIVANENANSMHAIGTGPNENMESGGVIEFTQQADHSTELPLFENDDNAA